MTSAIRIIGIDPGLRHCGWGVIESLGQTLSFVDADTISPPADGTMAQRLAILHGALSAVLARVKPDEAAVETTFVNRDAVATLKLGQARGVALVVPAVAGLPVAEYAPNMVKKSVVGAGHADKDQIRMMVSMLLPKAQMKSEHAADALAIAICHAHHRQMSAAGLGRRMRMGA